MKHSLGSMTKATSICCDWGGDLFKERNAWAESGIRSRNTPVPSSRIRLAPDLQWLNYPEHPFSLRVEMQRG